VPVVRDPLRPTKARAPERPGAGDW